MSEQLNIRVDSSLLKDIDDLAKKQNLERSALVRKVLIEGLQQERTNFALQKYLLQEISLERAAEIANISIHEMLQISAKYGIGSQFTIEDYQKMME
jgi:predicted HTH domain antitoxin